VCVCDPLNVTKLAKDIDIVNLLGSSSDQFGSSEANHIVVWSSTMSVMGREARDLVRTEFLEKNCKWTVEDIQERLRDKNLQDDFEYVLCDIARYGDNGILVEAEKASTILFLSYGWTIQTISMYLQDAPVNHLRNLERKDQEVATGEVDKVEMLQNASQEEKKSKRLKTIEEKAQEPAKEDIYFRTKRLRLEEFHLLASQLYRHLL